MTGTELLKVHKMAKEFAEMYSVTGLIGIQVEEGMPCAQFRADTFFEMFGDGEYEYEHLKDGDMNVHTKLDGVKYVAYISHWTKIKNGKVED
jgi:hypothetical protein